jgi:hypothetical protein
MSQQDKDKVKKNEIYIHRPDKFRRAIYEKYKHLCPNCQQSLYNGEPVELHHITSQKQGGQ